jgi:hypothetical protein
MSQFQVLSAGGPVAVFVTFDFSSGYDYGEGRIRTFEGFAGRFTVCSLWPLGNLTCELARGIEPPTS